jgi:uncharacterized protein (DUF2141 family)
MKMTRIQAASLLVAALGLSTVAFAEASTKGTLTVTVWNIQNDDGQIGCSLYSKEDGFPSDAKKADERMFVKQSSGKATCSFDGVKPENKDGKLETNMVGRPKEWWGVSNDVPAERFGPPKYEKASFPFDGSAKTVKVKLQL